MAPSATPTPMPAFAPVLRPLSDELDAPPAPAAAAEAEDEPAEAVELIDPELESLLLLDNGAEDDAEAAMLDSLALDVFVVAELL
jgi:hypothetical protein